jgi:L-ascorbate metabolism protein UlaG (beta-lactamase superfamily)
LLKEKTLSSQKHPFDGKTQESIPLDPARNILVESAHLSDSLKNALQSPCEEPELYWLGQAGFIFRSPSLTWAIDPYLSDRLAEKYRDHEFSHRRMMPAPLSLAELPELDFIFCTHHHGDHLDGPTLEWLAANRPRTQFIVPAGIAAEVSLLALPTERILWAEADRPMKLALDFEVTPVPSAHEMFSHDAAGHHRFLGYLFHCGLLKLYHSGDTVPYDGLNRRLAALGPMLALLPVNGRRRELSERNIPGNFSLTEAIELCRCARVQVMVAHHFGMFAFNTIDPALIDEAARAAAPAVKVLKAEVGARYRLRACA